MDRDRGKLLLALALVEQNPGCRLRDRGSNAWIIAAVLTMIILGSVL